MEATQDPSSTASRKTYFPKSSELAHERVLIPPMQCAEHRNQGQKSQPEEPLCGTPRGKTHTEQMTARTARTQSRDVQHTVSKYVAEMTQKSPCTTPVSTEPSSFTTAEEQNAERTRRHIGATAGAPSMPPATAPGPHPEAKPTLPSHNEAKPFTKPSVRTRSAQHCVGRGTSTICSRIHAVLLFQHFHALCSSSQISPICSTRASAAPSCFPCFH